MQYLSRGINAGTVNANSVDVYPESDLQQMSAMGLTYVRVPVLLDMIVAGAPRETSGVSTPADVAAAMSRLDTLVATLLNHGFAVTLCVFDTTGLQALPAAKSWPLYVQANQALAARYGHVDTHRIFLEVLNEPHMSPTQWNDLAPRLVTAARQNAPANTIIVDAAWNAIPTNLPYLVPSTDGNVIYTMHVYQPARLTAQGAQAPVDPNYLFPRPAGAKGAKGSEVAQEWTPAKLAAYVMTGVQWARQNNLPLIMNEFGSNIVCDPQSRINWLSFMRQIADANGVPWAMWDYYHLFPVAMAGQAPDFEPVTMKEIGPTPDLINFGISFKQATAPYLLTN